MQEPRVEIPQLLHTAEQIMAQSLGRPIHLQAGDDYSTNKSVVLRCHAQAVRDTPPLSVIVKQVRSDPRNYPYAPDDAMSPNAAHGLLDEWAALRLLETIANEPPLAPRFFGGDRTTGVLILEDMGLGATTTELVQGSDPDQASDALIAQCALLGRLHARTVGKAAIYRTHRAELGAQSITQPLFSQPWTPARQEPILDQEVLSVCRAYTAIFESVGLKPSAGIDAEIALVASQIEADPGVFLAYCQGDQNLPGGCIQCGPYLRLFDFDAGGFRHALIEGMPGRMTWGCMMRIPQDILPQMEHAYRKEFAYGCPDALDDAIFYPTLVAAGARWHIFHVLQRLPEALTNDRPRGPTTLRQQVIAWLEAFAQLSEEFGYFNALGCSARVMVTEVWRRWPVEPHQLPFYPAFIP
jgi:hypothetical protein